MSKNTKKKRTYHHLSAEEREIIFSMIQDHKSYSDIAKVLGRSRSTIMRERERNCFRRYDLSYSGVKAQEKAKKRWKQSHKKEWIKSPKLRSYIKRKLKSGWSPEQIAGRIKLQGKLPAVSYESIYQLIYNHRRDLIQFLPKQHKKRRKRGSAKGKRAPKIKNKTMIDQRPDEVAESIGKPILSSAEKVRRL